MNSAPSSHLRQVSRRADGHRASRRTMVAALLATATLLASACSGTGSGATSETSSTLTAGAPFAPNSLDPAKINPAYHWYTDLAYEPLIYWAPDGSLQPGLATAWRYIGEGNMEFELELRPDVEFSDGSALDADVVKANIDHFRQEGMSTTAYLAAVKLVNVIEPLKLRLTLSEPNPLLPKLFTQVYLIGNMISSKALSQPDKLASQTFGAGQYVLDPKETVTNDHYTYVRNPRYWDKNRVKYDKVVVKNLPNENTRLAALKTGQVDVIEATYATADAAKSAGLQISSAPVVFTGLALADRGGEQVRALKDVRVRQALNYAVDREKITKGLFGEYGVVTEQIVLPGQEGYSDENIYDYDPDKAKQLLVEAGYADGFTLPVVTTAFTTDVTQAMTDDLKAVGVRLEITADGDANKYMQDMASKKFAAYGIGFGSQPVHLMGPALFLPAAAQFNPFGSSDAEVESLYSKAAAADTDSRAALDQQLIARLNEQAWFVPVAFIPVLNYAASTVSGVELSAERPASNPTEWAPSTP